MSIQSLLVQKPVLFIMVAIFCPNERFQIAPNWHGQNIATSLERVRSEVHLSLLATDVNCRGDGLVVAEADGLLDELAHRQLHLEDGDVDPVGPDPHGGVLRHVEDVVVDDGGVLVGEGVLGVTVGGDLRVEPPAVAVEQLLEAVRHELPDRVVHRTFDVRVGKALGQAKRF